MLPNGTLIGEMIAFAILIWFCVHFIWPHINKAIEDRQVKIAEGLNAAERAHAELKSADVKVAGEIKQARLQASEIIDKAQQQANQIIDKARVERFFDGCFEVEPVNLIQVDVDRKSVV